MHITQVYSLNNNQVYNEGLDFQDETYFDIKSEEKSDAGIKYINENESDEESESEEDEDETQDVKLVKNPKFINLFQQIKSEGEHCIVDLEEEEELTDDFLHRRICNVCQIFIRNRNKFLYHFERHFAPDHFQCQSCFKGFVLLSHCQSHEIQEHFIEMSPEIIVKEKETEIIIPSTALYPYQGPKIIKSHEPYYIELNYGRNEKKSYSNIVSKHVGPARKRIEDNLSKIFAHNGSNSLDDISKPKKNLISNKKQIKQKDIFVDEYKNIIYFCNMCGFIGISINLFKKHLELNHNGQTIRNILEKFKVKDNTFIQAEEIARYNVGDLLANSIFKRHKRKRSICEEAENEETKENGRKINFLLKLNLFPTMDYLKLENIPSFYKK